MAERSYWKGHLRLSLVSCAVALYPAVGAASRLKCHTINRRTGNRINEEVVDAVTREPVPREDRVKGCEVARNEYVPVEEDELEHIRLESTHTINIESFVGRSEVDERYLDKPYYLAPEDKVSREAFAVMRDAMREKKKAGLGRLVISRRERVALIEPFGKGMLVTLLRAAGEVRSPTATFEGIGDFEASDDMRELAAQLIDRNSAAFDPSRFEDRYEQALVALVHAKAKPAGKAGHKSAANDDAVPARSNVVNLMEALKRSIRDEASAGGAKGPAKASPKTAKATGRAAAAKAAGAKPKRAAPALKKAG
ncbi:MAG TPA: Ku protein [Lichenihabitans sp.]|jgi:DNA end-binding protein Ku|nr:Ku protein [Lichenihabitans sp.]